jgi:hypothetical protein
MQSTLFPTAILAFSLSELSVSLDSTKLHFDALFLDRTLKHPHSSPVTILFKNISIVINRFNKLNRRSSALMFLIRR